MPGIIKERCAKMEKSGQILRTRPVSPPDGVMNGLNWTTQRRHSCLAGVETGHAGATSLNGDWP